jgi:hypothetical protein
MLGERSVAWIEMLGRLVVDMGRLFMNSAVTTPVPYVLSWTIEPGINGGQSFIR